MRLRAASASDRPKVRGKWIKPNGRFRTRQTTHLGSVNAALLFITLAHGSAGNLQAGCSLIPPVLIVHTGKPIYVHRAPPARFGPALVLWNLCLVFERTSSPLQCRSKKLGEWKFLGAC